MPPNAASRCQAAVARAPWGGMGPIDVVVPCYNEAARLQGPEARAESFARYALADRLLRFVFVDDGSRDETAATLKALCRLDPTRLRSFSLPHNVGKGEAVRAGMLEAIGAGAELIGYWDADLSTPLGELEPMVALLEGNSELDAVFGSRVQLLGRSIRRHTYRHAFGRVFATTVAAMLDLDVYDTQCGAKLFRASALETVLEAPFLSRWVFDVELLARWIEELERSEIEIADRLYEHPLRTWADVAGSKIGMKDAAFALRDLGRIAKRYRSALSRRRRRRTSGM